MDMTAARLDLYEELTQLGAKPELARLIERKLEDHSLAVVQHHALEFETRFSELATKADLNELKLVTKADLANLESRLLIAMNQQMRWFIGTVVATAGFALAVAKFM